MSYDFLPSIVSENSRKLNGIQKELVKPDSKASLIQIDHKMTRANFPENSFHRKLNLSDSETELNKSILYQLYHFTTLPKGKLNPLQHLVYQLQQVSYETIESGSDKESVEIIQKLLLITKEIFKELALKLIGPDFEPRNSKDSIERIQAYQKANCIWHIPDWMGETEHFAALVGMCQLDKNNTKKYLNLEEEKNKKSKNIDVYCLSLAKYEEALKSVPEKYGQSKEAQEIKHNAITADFLIVSDLKKENFSRNIQILNKIVTERVAKGIALKSQFGMVILSEFSPLGLKNELINFINAKHIEIQPQGDKLLDKYPTNETKKDNLLNEENQQRVNAKEKEYKSLLELIVPKEAALNFVNSELIGKQELKNISLESSNIESLNIAS